MDVINVCFPRKQTITCTKLTIKKVYALDVGIYSISIKFYDIRMQNDQRARLRVERSPLRPSARHEEAEVEWCDIRAQRRN